MTDGPTAETGAPLLDALIESTMETLMTMAMLATSCVRRCRESECGLGWDAGASMRLAGAKTGCIGVAAGMDCARMIVGRIVGQDIEEVSDADARNGLAEVLNMIAGNAKARLAGTPHHFELTIPTPWTGVRKGVCDAPGGGATAVFDVEGMAFAVCAHVG